MEKKSSRKTLALMIIFGLAFLILGSFLGFYFGTKMANATNEGSKEKVEEKEEVNDKDDETQEENKVSEALLKDLEKRAELSSRLSLSIVYDQYDEGLSGVFSENDTEDAYSIESLITYEYYLYKTGIKAKEWSTSDSSYGPCFEQSQNGYCYVVDKAEMLKYDKTMFNIGEKLLNGLEGYTLLKGDKYYVTGIPYGPANAEITDSETVSSVMNDDKSIDLVVKYSIDEDYEGFKANVVNYKYTFKLNADNDYYLYSVYEVK